MWVATLLLLWEAAAQSGFPPCGLLGEPLANVTVTWTPAVPSLQSLVTFNITGVSVSYSGWLEWRVVLTSQSSQFWSYIWGDSQLNEGVEFNYVFGYSFYGPLSIPSGLPTPFSQDTALIA